MYIVRIFSNKAIGSTIRKFGKAALKPWYYLGKHASKFVYEIQIDNLDVLDLLTGCSFEIKERTF